MEKIMKILVTGGSGFIGSHLSDKLTNEGHSVIIFDKKKSPWMNKKQKFISGDINDEKILIKATKNIDYVYHCAGLSDLNDSFNKPLLSAKSNILGSINLFESCVKNKVKKIILASSIYVFSKEGSFYRCSKKAVEDYIQEYSKQNKIKYTILRFGSIYGTRSDLSNGIYNLVYNSIKKKKILYHNKSDSSREYIHVKDIANACYEILNSKYDNKCLTLTGSEKISYNDLIEILSEITSLKKVKINKKIKNIGHYKITPYSYNPQIGLKYNLKENYDIGAGLVELIENIYNEINDKK